MRNWSKPRRMPFTAAFLSQGDPVGRATSPLEVSPAPALCFCCDDTDWTIITENIMWSQTHDKDYIILNFWMPFCLYVWLTKIGMWLSQIIKNKTWDKPDEFFNVTIPLYNKPTISSTSFCSRLILYMIPSQRVDLDSSWTYCICPLYCARPVVIRLKHLVWKWTQPSFIANTLDHGYQRHW